VSESLIGYRELAGQLGYSRGALRTMKLRGKLPPPDAPGPRWRPSTLFGPPARTGPVPAVLGPAPATTEASGPRVVVTITVEVRADGR